MTKQSSSLIPQRTYMFFPVEAILTTPVYTLAYTASVRLAEHLIQLAIPTPSVIHSQCNISSAHIIVTIPTPV